MNADQDPGADPAGEWDRPTFHEQVRHLIPDDLQFTARRWLPGDMVVTPESLRVHADWLDGCGHGVEPGEALRVEADRLDREATEARFVEDLARAIAAETTPHRASWDRLLEVTKANHLDAARAALDHLRPVAEWLAAERAEAARSVYRDEVEFQTERAEKAEAALIEIRPAGGMVLSADEVADVRTLVADDLDVEWDAAHGRLGALFAPRTWDSLDQVPHDVVVSDREGAKWEHCEGALWRLIGTSQYASDWRTAKNGPFTEITEVSL